MSEEDMVSRLLLLCYDLLTLSTLINKPIAFCRGFVECDCYFNSDLTVLTSTTRNF